MVLAVVVVGVVVVVVGGGFERVEENNWSVTRVASAGSMITYTQYPFCWMR